MLPTKISYLGMEPVGINLKETFGRVYRIELEDSHRPGEKIDPWYYIIPGKYGQIYPYGHDELCALTDRPKIKKKLAALEGGRIWQEGDWELVVRFHVSNAAAFFRLLRLRRKKAPSLGQLAALSRARAAHRPLAPATSEFLTATGQEGSRPREDGGSVPSGPGTA